MAGNSDSSNSGPNSTYFNDTDEADEDDCVIFKGSPLYECLVQNGYPVTEEESCLKSQVQNISTSERTEHKLGFQMNPKSVGQSNRLFNLWMQIYDSLLNKKRQRVNTNQTVLQRVKKCTVLDEDDADFLDWFIDSVDEKAVDDEKNTGQSKWLLVVIFPVILSYIYTRTINSTTTGNIFWLADSLTLFFLLYIVIQILALIIGLVQNRKGAIEIQCVDEFLLASEKLMTVLKKAVRLIQEAELIARGFTLVSQRNSLSRLEEGKKLTVRQCPTLRKLLFTCSRNSIYRFREGTKQVLSLIPSTAEIDITSGYLAFEPLENYGPCLQVAPEDSQSDVHLYRLTDGFSVSALQGISHLMMLHMSEFIKALAVFYHYTNKHRESELLATVLALTESKDLNQTAQTCSMILAFTSFFLDMDPGDILKLVTELTSEVTGWTESVQTSIDFHNSSLIRKEREDRQIGEKNEYSDLYIAVHSLDLHLQSALTRVRSLATDIESHMTLKDRTSGSHGQMNELIQPIKAELTSCNSCYSDAVSRLGRLCGKVDLEEEKAAVQVDPTWTDKDKPKTKIKEIEDFIIVDQVFEAYTDPDEMELENTDWEMPLSAEEKEKKRQEKEEAVRMLSELKSVIKVRAKETEKREIAALNRSKLLNRGLSGEEDSVYKAASDQDNNSYIEVPKVVRFKTESMCNELSQYQLKDQIEVNDKPFPKEKDYGSLLRHFNQESEDFNEAHSDKEDVPRCDYIDKETVENEIRKKKVEQMVLDHPSSTHCDDDEVARSVDKVLVIRSDNSSHDSWSESVLPKMDEFRTKSVVTQLGVRRLRKGTLLDDSDSDEETTVDTSVNDCDSVPKVCVEPNVINTSEFITNSKGSSITGENIPYKEGMNSTKIDETLQDDLVNDSESLDNIVCNETHVKHNRIEGFTKSTDNTLEIISNEESFSSITDGNNSDIEDNDEILNPRISSLSIEERLAKLSGLDFNLTSNIALMAAARSREFVKSEETTFGGDVFGELSESESEMEETS